VRLLITGATGFAGRHLTSYCAGLGHEVHALPHGVDVRDRETLARTLDDASPDAVAHLAGASSVGSSFADPLGTWDVNLGGTLALLEALREVAPEARAMIVSSGEVYGQVAEEDLPVGADTPLSPLSPYGASKAAADLAAGQYRASYGMPVMRVRAFNHVGPGQSPRFVLPSVARQIAQAEHEGRERVEVRVGNVDTRRDFTDVRDMVRAYALILERGDPDAVYLACSGRSRPVRELIEGLAPLARIPVTFASDAGLRRAGEQADLYGSPARLRDDTGWTPEIPIETTLADTLDWWRERVVDEDRE
jgi:GDP-4-dehydro-6-deoxy-D-mannose reductase